ncbi:MAG: hypothetical protein LBH87_01700 [Coriobacteriales bacterium]|nr:hypothetical protein [Coriobacteriales bacterium]
MPDIGEIIAILVLLAAVGLGVFLLVRRIRGKGSVGCGCDKGSCNGCAYMSGCDLADDSSGSGGAGCGERGERGGEREGREGRGGECEGREGRDEH